jgi:hypothetical protein
MTLTFRGRLLRNVVEEIPASACKSVRYLISQCIAMQAYAFTGTKGRSVPVIVALTRCRSGIAWSSCSVIGYRIGALIDTESQLHAARQISWRASQAPYSDVWPFVSTNSYCTRASYDSELKVFISSQSQVSFSVADIWPATSTYPAVSNLFRALKAQLRLCPDP